PKLGAYAGLASLGLLAALATRRPELVAVAAPFALAAALGLLLARRPEVDAGVRLTVERTLEGDELELEVALEAAVGAERLELLLELPRELVVDGGENPVLLRMRDGERRDVSFRVRCKRWGAFRIRRVNWRASARRGELWVNEHHAERNADVVILVDSFAEVRQGERTTLDPALRAAASLAARYLRQKDRVGFLSFGGFLNWLLPSTGVTQLYRIIDSLPDTQIVLNYAWKDLDVLPRRTLPPKAVVIALTPLLHDR